MLNVAACLTPRVVETGGTLQSAAAAASVCFLHSLTCSSFRCIISQVYVNLLGSKFMHVLEMYFGKQLAHPDRFFLMLIVKRTQLPLKQKNKS